MDLPEPGRETHVAIGGWVPAEADTTAVRAAVGDPRRSANALPTLVGELRLALRASGATPPYVLVGHSFGGLIVRAYAYTHPHEVAGLVLVDAAHEDRLTMYPAAYAATAAEMGATMARLRLAFRAFTGSGVPALLARSFPDPTDAIRRVLGRSTRR